MDVFTTYLQLGFQHIADVAGYDHILFILTLCGVYLIEKRKQVIILVTAFTIGHSITLALATFDLLRVPSAVVEFLIPLTIFITAISNVKTKTIKYSSRLHCLKYGIAVFFGLIHGLGFSNYLRSLLGNEFSLFEPLLAFNIGLEIGQLLIVFIIMLLSYFFVKLRKMPHREWNLVISGAGMGVSLTLMLDRITDLF